MGAGRELGEETHMAKIDFTYPKAIITQSNRTPGDRPGFNHRLLTKFAPDRAAQLRL